MSIHVLYKFKIKKKLKTIKFAPELLNLLRLILCKIFKSGRLPILKILQAWLKYINKYSWIPVYLKLKNWNKSHTEVIFSLTQRLFTNFSCNTAGENDVACSPLDEVRKDGFRERYGTQCVYVYDLFIHFQWTSLNEGSLGSASIVH